MLTRDDGTHRVNRWRDLREFFQGALAPASLDDRLRASVSRHRELGSIADAVLLARRGWADGVKDIENLRAKIARQLEGRERGLTVEHDVTGDFFDVGMVLEGDPEHWGTFVDSGRRYDTPIARVIRIVCNVSASRSVGAETFLRRGAAVVVLVDTLERHGIRCQVDVVKATTNAVHNGATLENVVTVKADNEHMSIDKLAFMVGHIATLRRLFWSVQEHEDLNTRKRFGIGGDTRNSYGFPGEASDRGDIYVGRMLTPRDWDEDFTMAWLQAKLSEQGILLESKV